MVFALVAVLVFLIAAVAIVRSFNTSLFQAGNLAFKRDLTNQSERAMNLVFSKMRSGPLDTETQRAADVRAENFSASILPTNAQGIPSALLNDTTFATVGAVSNDIALTDPNGTTFGSVRYVVERLCNSAGDAATLGAGACVLTPSIKSNSTSSSEWIRAENRTSAGPGALVDRVVYRVTIRVNGPRATQGFFQSTFTR